MKQSCINNAIQNRPIQGYSIHNKFKKFCKKLKRQNKITNKDKKLDPKLYSKDAQKDSKNCQRINSEQIQMQNSNSHIFTKQGYYRPENGTKNHAKHEAQSEDDVDSKMNPQDLNHCSNPMIGIKVNITSEKCEPSRGARLFDLKQNNSCDYEHAQVATSYDLFVENSNEDTNSKKIYQNIQQEQNQDDLSRILFRRSSSFSQRAQSVFLERTKLAESQNDQSQLNAIEIYYSNVAKKISNLSISSQKKRHLQYNYNIQKYQQLLTDRNPTESSDLKSSRRTNSNLVNDPYKEVEEAKAAKSHSDASKVLNYRRSNSTNHQRNWSSTNILIKDIPAQKLIKRSRYRRDRNCFLNSRRNSNSYLPFLSQM
ncbi:unnamed protein product [Moneuplotes crassus]|uniref:Uncharacterized protein n=1 Tax=Euplotes crassus TaxID=5936 RepID=A0AAD1U8M2_EUPCR|nr:unnamed protein product [Moneuplotes crassus]